MKRLAAIILTVILVCACYGTVSADTERSELFENVSNFCLTMARKYVDAYNGGSERNEYVVAAYRYYEAYLDTQGIVTAESYVDLGFIDSGALTAEKMLAFGMLNQNIREAYEKWLDGTRDAAEVMRLIDSAVTGAEKVR